MMSKEKKEFMLKIFDYFTEIFIKIMLAIMYIAPIGVFCLMADATGTFGYDVLVKIVYLIVLYVIVLAIVTYVMVGGTVAAFSKCTTYKNFFKSMWKVQLFAILASIAPVSKIHISNKKGKQLHMPLDDGGF